MQFHQPLASTSQLQLTPSAEDGVPAELEADLRTFGALCIQQAGVLLDLPQVVVATSCVLFHRFWYITSLKQFGVLDTALSCVFLAGKLEEHTHLRMRDLINAFHFIQKRVEHEQAATTLARARAKLPQLSASSSSKPFTYEPMDYFDKLFYDMKEEAVIGEMQLLKRLGFNLIIKHPYGPLVNYLQVLGLANHPSIPQRAWAYLNDSLLTALPAIHPPHVIACAVIYLATVESAQLQPTALRPPLGSSSTSEPVALPVGWWRLFKVESEAQIMDITAKLLQQYERWSPSDTVWQRAAELKLPLNKAALRHRLEQESGKATNGR